MKLDLSQCTDEDIDFTIQELQAVLLNRKQVALKAFRKDNPVLGYSYQDESAWSGFWVTSSDDNLEDRLGFSERLSNPIIMPVRNSDLKRLLGSGNLVHFPVDLNVAALADTKSSWTPWKK